MYAGQLHHSSLRNALPNFSRPVPILLKAGHVQSLTETLHCLVRYACSRVRRDQSIQVTQHIRLGWVELASRDAVNKPMKENVCVMTVPANETVPHYGQG